MYRIGKSFSFDASHQLGGLPEGHKCGRLHGHTYTVTVELASHTLTAPGFVADFGELAPVKRYLDAAMDHRHLNNVMNVEPTSENLAAHLFSWCVANLPPDVAAMVAAVRVSETPSSWAEYRMGAGT